MEGRGREGWKLISNRWREVEEMRDEEGYVKMVYFMLNLMVLKCLKVFLNLFLHFILFIFQAAEIIGGQNDMFAPNIFIGGAAYIS